MANKGYWMQQARRRMVVNGTVGSFTAWCKRQGYKGVTASCICRGLRSKNKAIVKKATFAKAAWKTKGKSVPC